MTHMSTSPAPINFQMIHWSAIMRESEWLYMTYGRSLGTASCEYICKAKKFVAYWQMSIELKTTRLFKKGNRHGPGAHKMQPGSRNQGDARPLPPRIKIGWECNGMTARVAWSLRVERPTTAWTTLIALLWSIYGTMMIMYFILTLRCPLEH